MLFDSEAFGVSPYIDGNEATQPSVFRLETPPLEDDMHRSLRNKLVSRDRVSSVGEAYRTLGETIVFTSGTYDMIHNGHSRYLAVAKSLGTVLVVGINADASVRKYKGPDRPILTAVRRAEQLAHLGYVDRVVIFEEDHPTEVIRDLKPHRSLTIEEGEFVGKMQERPDARAVLESGGEVYISPRQDPELSTSKLIEKIMEDGSRRLARKIRPLLNGNGSTVWEAIEAVNEESIRDALKRLSLLVNDDGVHSGSL